MTCRFSPKWPIMEQQLFLQPCASCSALSFACPCQVEHVCRFRTNGESMSVLAQRCWCSGLHYCESSLGACWSSSEVLLQHFKQRCIEQGTCPLFPAVFNLDRSQSTPDHMQLLVHHVLLIAHRPSCQLSIPATGRSILWSATWWTVCISVHECNWILSQNVQPFHPPSFQI